VGTHRPEGLVVRNAVDAFSSRITRDGETLQVFLEGDADMSAVEEIGRMLEDVHKAARTAPTNVVLVDLRNLEFMNSSCFKKFVSWLGRVQELAKDKQYMIRFISDPHMHWQRRSLHVLQCFAPSVVSVET
jgi:hypothetical protein